MDNKNLNISNTYWEAWAQISQDVKYKMGLGVVTKIL